MRHRHSLTSHVPDTRAIDLAILIHMSPQMKPADLKKFLKPFLNALLQYADIDGGKVQVSLSYYRKQLTLISNLKKFKTRADYANAVNSLSMKVSGKQGDGAAALKRLRERVFDESRGDRPEVHNVVLIVTDDKNSGDQKKFFQEAEKTKSSGIRVVTFGVGNADRNELYQVASGPGDVNSMHIPRYSDMQDEETIDTLRSKVFACKSYIMYVGPCSLCLRFKRRPLISFVHETGLPHDLAPVMLLHKLYEVKKKGFSA